MVKGFTMEQPKKTSHLHLFFSLTLFAICLALSFVLIRNSGLVGMDERMGIAPAIETAYVRMPFPENEDMLRKMAEDLLKQEQYQPQNLQDIQPAAGN